MSYTQRWAFDVEVEGEDSHYSISDLFRLADECKASRKYDECLVFLLRTATSPSGKFKLAKFYLETPEINLPQSVRFCEAEKLLLDLHPHCIAACIELSTLYLDKLSRPIAALAYLLRAKKLGANIEPVLIERCKGNIIRSGIAETEYNQRDCYELGIVLSEQTLDSAKNSAVYFLQAACESKIVSLYSALAALTLAELFEEKKDYESARKYYSLATELGNPPLLL